MTAGLAKGQTGGRMAQGPVHSFNSPFLPQVLARKQPDTFQRTQKMIGRRRKSGNSPVQNAVRSCMFSLKFFFFKLKIDEGPWGEKSEEEMSRLGVLVS